MRLSGMTEVGGDDRTADKSVRHSTQYLAVPLTDGLVPSHRVASRWVRARRRNATALLTGAALILAGAGALVSSAPRPVSVYANASHVYIGGVVLARASASPVSGYTMYGGDAVVLLSSARVTARAAGAATLNGSRVSGACIRVVEAPALTERCTFVVRGARVTSQDTFDPRAHVWRRTYSDGTTEEFAVPSGQTVIPIPLPLGR